MSFPAFSPGTLPDRPVIPETLDCSFEGFTFEAFAILDRLRLHPHVERYRVEKQGVKRWIQEPFARYRDDLVLNLVLPNRLPLETEKNVFSRLLKNDFGAGGCHHHLWMSFYRPHRRRLTDVQLSHTIRPEGFDVGVFVGSQAGPVFRQARARIVKRPEAFLALVNPLLQGPWILAFRGGKSGERSHFEAPLRELPEQAARVQSLWARTMVPRADILADGPGLLRWSLEAIGSVWPLYRFLLDET